MTPKTADHHSTSEILTSSERGWPEVHVIRHGGDYSGTVVARYRVVRGVLEGTRGFGSAWKRGVTPEHELSADAAMHLGISL